MLRLALAAALLALGTAPSLAAGNQFVPAGRGGYAMLNPQPLPPEPPPEKLFSRGILTSPGMLNTLNPQPLPPGGGIGLQQQRR
ncbi:hypothetical protein [Paracraurococcus lichenis]|uniref:Uncharacterized protein n=1 Tax=Paracraurococcus lichenis TaxID=3064888 RepID=A0ABT9E3W5_9PROT|nr:hypothetical protein [Paracraurococcus sp. LOR1-02]MDO9710860.1 hypothetical protein [Paracraurococcus sp. LOR1-02]